MIDPTPDRKFAPPRVVLARLHVARAIGWSLLALMLAAGGPGGCAAIPLATLGTIAGAAGPAVGAGQEIYSMGKLDTAELQRGADVALAARKAALEMGFERKPDPNERAPGHPYLEELEFLDRHGDGVTVRVDERAERLVLLRIDVGIFGSEPMARLFLNRLRTHLPGSSLRGSQSSG